MTKRPAAGAVLLLAASLALGPSGVLATGPATGVRAAAVQAPSVDTSFGATQIPLNGTTTVTVGLANPNASIRLTGVGITDTLPTGLAVAPTPNVTNTCGGTVAAAAGSGSASLTGGSLEANASCSFTFSVKGTVAGRLTNGFGFPYSNESGEGGGYASAALAVVAPPVIAKSFTPSAMAPGGTSSLQVTITNPAVNTVALTGVAFTDNLPPSLVVSTPSGLSSTCGGTAAAVAGSGSVSLSGATIGVAASCAVTVSVTPATHAFFFNATDPVLSSNGGTGNQGYATLSVAVPPTIAKTFGASSILVGGTTTLTFTVTAGADPLDGVGFTDNLPAGLVVAAGSAQPSCGNAAAGLVTAVAGSSTITVSGGTYFPGASCTITVNVTGTTAGVKSNSVQVTATESGPGNTATATLTVVGPPTITKAFGAPTIPVGGATTLTFTFTNPNASTTLTGIAVTDSLPAGLEADPLWGSSTTCPNGRVIGIGQTSVSVTNLTLTAGASCTVTVHVKGATAGVKDNTTGSITSVEGGTGDTASASITVVAPPTITKSFSATTMPLGGTRTLTFTLVNPNGTVALSGVAFTDALQTGLVVATPAAVTSTCSGTVTAAAGSSSIALTGGTLGVSTSCTITVGVTATSAGVKVNTTGPVSAAQSGQGLGSNTATVTVYPPPTITSFSPASGPAGTRLTIRGSHFTAAMSAAVNGTPLTGMTVVDDTTITGIIAAGTTSGTVTVTTPGGTAASAGVFTVSFAPTVTGFSPLSGRPGTIVTITGIGFPYVRSVTIGGKAAAFSVRSPSMIVATVPVGAVTGRIVVTSAYGTGASAQSFSVLP